VWILGRGEGRGVWRNRQSSVDMWQVYINNKYISEEKKSAAVNVLHAVLDNR
jgi:hypothetical protein